MAKINILPSKVYNRIAAGEVVDRPCSVVKELVENALDAGATEIEIYIEQGGKQLIRVVDNGCGIEREDLQSAFLPHATSKISTADDLSNITTLGFRGEAIASISAVSKMTIASKTEKGKCYKLSCDGGELGQITETSGRKGTDVCVELLFYHTPVRLGFLKSDKAEETEITNFVSRFILSRPEVAFTYYANGKKVLQSFGGGEEEAMACVYGAATLSQCFCVDAVKHGLRIRGYIGNQNFYKPNKSYQSVFLNGRYIVNVTIATAISTAYASYLMKRQYPFYVLHIDMPAELVDVNVHPNKADVRFADNQIVFGCVNRVIAAILDGQTKGLEYVAKAPALTEDFSTNEEKAPSTAPVQPIIVEEFKGTPFVSSLTYEQAKKEIEESAPAFTAKKQGIELPFSFETEEKEKVVEDGPLENPKANYPAGFIPMEQIGPYVPELKRASVSARSYTFAAPHEDMERFEKTADTFQSNKLYLNELDEKQKQDKIDVYEWRYAGKLFNTYLLYEYGDEAYIVDQHAAHERLIFDELKKKMQNRMIITQPMLMPFEIRLNAFESQFIREQTDAILEMGFNLYEMEENCFAVSEVPIDLQDIDLKRFFNEILGEVNVYRGIKLEELVKDKLASAACKAAVKGGMDLSREEIDELFALMDGNMGLKCPHGRPVVVQMTKKQLEKLFKRIV